MRTLRTLFIVASVAFASQSAWSHGLLEKISCSSNQELGIHFFGLESHSSSGPNQLHFFAHSADAGLIDLWTATYRLEDQFVNGMIVEKISIEFQNNAGKALLMIPEDYQTKEREGEGKLMLDNLALNAELECVVMYE